MTGTGAGVVAIGVVRGLDIVGGSVVVLVLLFSYT